jgi:nitrite reductase (NO-forming)
MGDLEMSMSPRIAALVVSGVLLAGCAATAGPHWTYAPGSDAPGAPASATPAASATAAASGTPAPATPSSRPSADGVLPILTPKADLELVPQTEVNVAYAPNVPPPSGRTTQAIVEVHFDVVEGVKAIDPNGQQYMTWGYRLAGDTAVTSGTSGPMIRARVGDVLRFVLTNLGTMPHNVDFHAVTGQGGGAKDTTVAPGETATIEGRLLYPGFFMYHCAAGDVPMHIAQGMYGGILVDPEVSLPAVQHELYMVQSEYYTTTAADGSLVTDRQAITDEQPTYVVFNGALGSLTGDNAPHMRVGETMRIYFVNAGLNLDSNFHPIGSHWDKVYTEGALLNQPMRGSQTTLVAAGGSTVVELIGQVPMTVVLVDHALARAFDKGAIGQIVIEGDPNPEIFEAFGIEPANPGSPSPSPTGSAPSPTSSAPTPSGSPAGGSPQVSILAGSGTFQATDAPGEYDEVENPGDYSVNMLMVALGTTVTWTNDDPSMPHTVTVDGLFDSGVLQTGQTFSYTFDTPGEFEYYCTLHPWMRAKVMVEMH